MNDEFDATLKIQPGHWYGFPDFSAAREPLTMAKFDSPDELSVLRVCLISRLAVVYVNDKAGEVQNAARRYQRAERSGRACASVERRKKKMTPQNNEEGLIKYGIAWLLGVPLSLLILIFLLSRGC